MQKIKESELSTEEIRSFNTARLEWEWHLHQKLREVPEEEPERDWSCSPKVEAETRRLAEESAARMGGEVKVGQLRMLADTDMPVYIAVIKEWMPDMFICIPFSLYSYPGLETDLKVTSISGMRCEVLQCWMGHTLFRKTLERSWVDEDVELSQKDLDDAFLLWKSTFSDVEIPDEVLRRTGSDEPVTDPDNWILKYQQEAMDNFAKVFSKDTALLDKAEEETTDVGAERTYYVTDWPFGRVHKVVARSEAEASKKFLRDNAGAPLNMQVEVASITTEPPEQEE